MFMGIEMNAERTSFLFVMGFADDGLHGCVVRPVDAPDGAAGAHLNLRPDMSTALTRDRCSTLLQEARAMTGRNLHRIEVHDSEYSKTPGNECGDFEETCYRDKRYIYEARTDALTIVDDGDVVYINEGGNILRGDDAAVAHADSLDL